MVTALRTMIPEDKYYLIKSSRFLNDIWSNPMDPSDHIEPMLLEKSNIGTIGMPIEDLLEKISNDREAINKNYDR